MKILFAASEAHPLIKTGGLADVAGALPVALKRMRHDVRLILPAYPQALQLLEQPKRVATLKLAASPEVAQIIEGRLPGSTVKVYLVDIPLYFNRPGNPYHNIDHVGWPDNGPRFAAFCRAVVEIAQDRAKLNWQPDLIHCNDWQSGLVPTLLAQEQRRPATLFTIHNLAYSGSFDWANFQALKLPYDLWSMEGLEFYGNFSFMKGGIIFADHVSTVSPTYARQICTADYGNGFEGLLQERADSLSGILNGVDYQIWDPSSDALIPHNYNARDLSGKAANKRALQKRMGLPLKADVPLIGHIGRQVSQKGADLIIGSLPQLLKRPVQLVVLGGGDKKIEQALRIAAAKHPKQVAIKIGYDEPLAHLIEAGADIFLMPSRFEPCGLNQIYSLRYGTVPIVRRTGGLADTVIDTMAHTLAAGVATGFVFDDPSTWAMTSTVNHALDCFDDSKLWSKIVRAGMKQEFSWKIAARQYVALYRSLIDKN